MKAEVTMANIKRNPNKAWQCLALHALGLASLEDVVGVIDMTTFDTWKRAVFGCSIRH